jgi:hypothetical protein
MMNLALDVRLGIWSWTVRQDLFANSMYYNQFTSRHSYLMLCSLYFDFLGGILIELDEIRNWGLGTV